MNVLVAQLCDFLRSYGLQPTRFLCPWNSPGKNAGVGCHSLLQGIFLTQGLNRGLLHCRQILYHLSHERSPKYYAWACQNWEFGSKDQDLECIHKSAATWWKSAASSVAVFTILVLWWLPLLMETNLVLKLYNLIGVWRLIKNNPEFENTNSNNREHL